MKEMTDRGANNRKLAEWLDLAVDSDGISVYGDFYTSEDASAMLRQALAKRPELTLHIRIDPDGLTEVDVSTLPAIFDEDYKTAIAQAALALMEAEKSNDQ